MSQTKSGAPKTATSKPSWGKIQNNDKTTGANELLEKKLDIQTQVDVKIQPSCSAISSDKRKTIPPGKRIHVLSDITIEYVNQLITKKKKIRKQRK